MSCHTLFFPVQIVWSIFTAISTNHYPSRRRRLRRCLNNCCDDATSARLLMLNHVFIVSIINLICICIWLSSDNCWYGWLVWLWCWCGRHRSGARLLCMRLQMWMRMCHRYTVWTVITAFYIQRIIPWKFAAQHKFQRWWHFNINRWWDWY